MLHHASTKELHPADLGWEALYEAAASFRTGATGNVLWCQVYRPIWSGVCRFLAGLLDGRERRTLGEVLKRMEVTPPEREDPSELRCSLVDPVDINELTSTPFPTIMDVRRPLKWAMHRRMRPVENQNGLAVVAIGITRRLPQNATEKAAEGGCGPLRCI